jgi:hypothetical protein
LKDKETERLIDTEREGRGGREEMEKKEKREVEEVYFKKFLSEDG